jgi:hypothetical protein
LSEPKFTEFKNLQNFLCTGSRMVRCPFPLSEPEFAEFWNFQNNSGNSKILVKFAPKVAQIHQTLCSQGFGLANKSGKEKRGRK